MGSENMPSVHKPADAVDTPCQICSMSIPSGSLVFFQYGEILHASCRRQARGWAVLQEIERAKLAQERAARLINNLEHRFEQVRRLSRRTSR
jgi:hypothetical protein